MRVQVRPHRYDAITSQAVGVRLRTLLSSGVAGSVAGLAGTR